MKPKRPRGRPRQSQLARRNIHIQLTSTLLAAFDRVRGDTSRSLFIDRCLSEHPQIRALLYEELS